MEVRKRKKKGNKLQLGTKIKGIKLNDYERNTMNKNVRKKMKEGQSKVRVRKDKMEKNAVNYIR